MFKSLKKKFLSNKKGFTLMELMIVIAIIGILAVVLLPQANKMRDNARTSGVEANMRAVAAQLETLIGDYSSSSADQTKLINALQTRLGGSITNPFNQTTGAAIFSGTINDIVTPVAVAITADTTVNTIYSVAGSKDVMPNGLGSVVVSIYPGAGNKLEASIFGYGRNGSNSTDGKAITTDKKIIKVND